MKRTGTIKVEIIKPLNVTWNEAGARMRALSRALAPALNSTMRTLFPAAEGQIEQKRAGEKKPDTKWQSKARAELRERWAVQLARTLDYERGEFQRGRLKSEPDVRAFMPVESATAGETVNLLLLSRFTGDHMQDLIACRASIPSWSGMQAMYTEGRACLIEGAAAKARLRLPLWGTGVKGGVVFAVDPAGKNDRARWRRLVSGFARRDVVVGLENKIKALKSEAGELTRQIKETVEKHPEADVSMLEQARADKTNEHKRITCQLEEMHVIKLGRVGWKHNKRKGKWFAFLSWTEYLPSLTPGKGQMAAVNYGVNVFAQALTEDGKEWTDHGADIRVTRARFVARRKNLQRAQRSLGRGSQGHGSKRRNLPITRLGDKESRWVENRVRTHAAHLIKWCVSHHVTKLLLHDLSNQRENFEQKTQGEAPEELKRFIHSWPWYQARCAVEREGEERGVEVELMELVKPVKGGKTKGDSTACPECGHDSPENIQLVDGGGEVKIIPNLELVVIGKQRFFREISGEPRLYREINKWIRFKCEKCEHKAKGDLVTCANMLVRGGAAQKPLRKMQEKARERAKSAIKTVAAGKGIRR